MFSSQFKSLFLCLRISFQYSRNTTGPVERRQDLKHAKLYAFLQAMKSIPENLFKNVCLCVDEMPLISFIAVTLRTMSENSFRSTYTGKLNKDLETSMEINKVIRLRTDLTLRMKYVPNDVGVHEIYLASKMSIKTADELTKLLKLKRKIV